MKKQVLLILGVFIILLLNGCRQQNVFDDATEENKIPQTQPENPILKNIKLPDGFKIDVFTSDFGKSLNLPGPNKGARFMEFYNDVLFVSLPSSGAIAALPDRNKDGKA